MATASQFGDKSIRMIDHFIQGGTTGLASTRKGAVMDPNNGGQQAEVALGSADALERALEDVALDRFRPQHRDPTLKRLPIALQLVVFALQHSHLLAILFLGQQTAIAVHRVPDKIG